MAAGFRCAGQIGQHLVDIPEPAADPGGGQPAGRAGPQPGGAPKTPGPASGRRTRKRAGRAALLAGACRPTAATVSVLCVAVVVEIVAVPAVLLPGGTMTLLAGALIGSGRPALAVTVPVVAAVVGGDQLAYFSGAAVTGWWRRRRPRRIEGAGRAGGRTAAWYGGSAPCGAGARPPVTAQRVPGHQAPAPAPHSPGRRTAGRRTAGALRTCAYFPARRHSGSRTDRRCSRAGRRSPGTPRRRAGS